MQEITAKRRTEKKLREMGFGRGTSKEIVSAVFDECWAACDELHAKKYGRFYQLINRLGLTGK